MVSAWMAEVTTHEIVVKNPAGSVVSSKRLDLVDEGDAHGVDRDTADAELESMGYLVSSFRWQEHGHYYRAVVVPEEKFREREARRAQTGRR
jgi:hypothetical protein